MTDRQPTPEQIEEKAIALHHASPDGWVIRFSDLYESSKATWRERARSILVDELKEPPALSRGASQ